MNTMKVMSDVSQALTELGYLSGAYDVNPVSAGRWLVVAWPTDEIIGMWDEDRKTFVD
jgi:hypothetical protein